MGVAFQVGKVSPMKLETRLHAVWCIFCQGPELHQFLKLNISIQLNPNFNPNFHGLSSKLSNTAFLARVSSVLEAARYLSCKHWSFPKDVWNKPKAATRLDFWAFATALWASAMWVSWAIPVAS